MLFVHQNFPGQFIHLATALAQGGHEVAALTIAGRDLPGVRVQRYPLSRDRSPTVHPLADDFAAKVIRGESCAHAAAAWKQQGFRPDLIVAHPGWGESLFLKDVWPDVPLLALLEFYYRPRGADVGFDPEFPEEGWPAAARVQVKNAHLGLTLDAMDLGYSPTRWQRQSHPAPYHHRIEVVHDGIDTATVAPAERCGLRLRDSGRILSAADEVLTFVARSLEPCRGYHRFMRALPEILRRRPKAVALIVGGDDISYGRKPPQGSWKEIFLDEVRERLDLSRVFFLGKIPYPDYLTVLRISSCHVYLTYPFVLSWSMLEAMSAGCVVVGAAVPPVQEVIEHGRNGLLVDFFDTEGLASAVTEVLANRPAMASLRRAARQTILDNYDLGSVCLPRQMELVRRLVL